MGVTMAATGDIPSNTGALEMARGDDHGQEVARLTALEHQREPSR